MKLMNRISHIEVVIGLILIYCFCMNCCSLESAEKPAKKNANKDHVFIEKIENLCKKIEEERFSRKEVNDKTARDQLITKIDILSRSISDHTGSENAKNWKLYLGLEDLVKELKQDQPKMDVLKRSLASFESGANGLDHPMFSDVRKDLKALFAARDQIKYTQQEKEDFRVIRENLPNDIRSLLQNYDMDLAELTAISLSYLGEHGAKKDLYEDLKKTILDRFSSPNVLLAASSRIFESSPFVEEFDINEMIRGSWVQGSGIAEGSTSMKFVPNKEKAEIRLQLDANVFTKTVSSQKEVYVHSNSQGNVFGEKTIYFDQQFESDPGSASAKMDSTITGISSSRVFGWGIIQQRVAEEFPYSAAESQKRMGKRFADRMNEGFDTQIKPIQDNMNHRFRSFLNNIDFMPESIRTSTTEKNLFWKSNFSVKEQLAVPVGTSQEKKLEPKSDLVFALHESCLNNMTYNTYSGKKISDQQIADQFVPFLSADQKAQKCTDEPLWLFFANDLPIQTKFDKDEIFVQLRLDGFEKEKNVYPELTVRIVYKIEKNAKGFLLRQKELDASPGNLQPGQTIPARYQVIRSLLLKKLEDLLKKEYVVPVVRMADQAKGNAKDENEIQQSHRIFGSFIPVRFTTQNKWLELEYKFEPDPVKDRSIKKSNLKMDGLGSDKGLDCAFQNSEHKCNG